MTDSVATRSRRGPATAQTVEDLHADLDGLWAEANTVAEPDRLAFTLAVVEAASNVVNHAVPAAGEDVDLAVELTATPSRLQAQLFEINARPSAVDLHADRPMDTLDDSGRGLALIRTLVDTVVFERQDETNVWVLVRQREAAGD